MAVLGVCLLLFLALSGHSSATYCICKDGVSDLLLQTNIDYACGAGADCSQIQQIGACYNPNTVKDHCNYAVNSYYQRNNQTSGCCDFAGTATITQTIPPNQISGCVYPANPSTAGTSTTTNPSSTTSSSVFGLGPTGSGGISSTNNQAGVTQHKTKTTLLFWSLTSAFLLLGPICPAV